MPNDFASLLDKMDARPLRDPAENTTTEQGAGSRLLPELCRDLKIAPLSGAELVD